MTGCYTNETHISVIKLAERNSLAKLLSTLGGDSFHFEFEACPINRILDHTVLVIKGGIDVADRWASLLGIILTKADFEGLGWPRGWIPDLGPHVGQSAVEKGIINVHKDDNLGGASPGNVTVE